MRRLFMVLTGAAVAVVALWLLTRRSVQSHEAKAGDQPQQLQTEVSLNTAKVDDIPSKVTLLSTQHPEGQPVGAVPAIKLNGFPKSLENVGEEDVEELKRLLQSSDVEHREFAAVALCRIGTSASLAAVVKTTEGIADMELQRNLSDIIASVTNVSASAALIDAVRFSASESCRDAARSALARIADVGVVSDLIGAYLAEENVRARLQIAMTLGSISNPAASGSLRQVAELSPTNLAGPLALYAVDALARIGGAAETAYLLERIPTASERDRTALVNAVSLAGGTDAKPIIEQAATTSPNEYVRVAAILALGNYPSPATVTLLEQIRSGRQLSRDEARAIEFSMKKAVTHSKE